MDSSYGTFWLEMVRSRFGTAGPLWFLWLLLAFDCLATRLYRVAPLPGTLIRRRSTIILGSPAAFFRALIGISITAYLPMAIIIGPLEWIGIGPFNAQVSRILLYLVYFLAGTAIGAYGINRSMFRSDGPLAKGWWWLVMGLMSYIVFIIMVVVVTDRDRTIVSEIAFVLCCGATVFGMTGFFLRFVKRRIGIFDSLSENAYGIYVVCLMLFKGLFGIEIAIGIAIEHIRRVVAFDPDPDFDGFPPVWNPLRLTMALFFKRIKVTVQFGFSLGIDDADVHFPCMQIDAAIKFVVLIVKSHGVPPFSFSGLMAVVSITYTSESKEATRSDIFRPRMGP